MVIIDIPMVIESGGPEDVVERMDVDEDMV